MNEEVVSFEYEGSVVEFLPTGKDLMVNATEMAKIFGKEVARFMENESTQNFINACLNRAQKTRNSSFLSEGKNQNYGFLNVQSKEDLVSSKQKSGTWMHRVLALKFAAWLNPDFEVWVFVTIDQILNGNLNKQRDAMREKIKLQQRKASLEEELMEKYPEFKEYKEIEGKLKKAKSAQVAAVKAEAKQLSIEFFKN